MRPTARGIGLLLGGLALLFLATAMRSATIATLAAVVLAAPLLSLAWLGVRQIGGAPIRVRRVITPLRPSAGELVRVAPHVTSGTLDASTSLRERIPASLHRGSTSPAGYTLQPALRGVYPLGPATVVRTDPLMLARSRSIAPGTDELVVWPVVDDLTALVRTWADHQSTHSQRGRPERAPDDLTLREYQPGDELHRVHWRASARHGALLTRKDEPAQDRDASVVLDLGPAQAPHPNSAAEWLVSATASMAVALIDAGYRLHLTLTWAGPPTRAVGSPRRERGGPISVGETADALDLLTRAHSGSPRPEPIHRGLAIAALRSPSPEIVRTLTAWSGNRIALLVEASTAAETLLADAGWVVQTAEAGAGIEEAWSTLLGGAP